MGLCNDIVRRRELLGMLIRRNLKIRYKNSALGFLWTLLAPLSLIAIYALFLGLMRFPVRLPMLVTGIFVWQYLAMCLGDSLHAIVGHGNLVKKAAFPRIILPLAMALANLTNFLLSLIVVGVYLAFAGASLPHLGWMPAVVLTHLALSVGVSLLLSSLNVFFRDLEHLLSVLTMAWFFATPVIYSLEEVAGRFGAGWMTAYFANPMAGIVTVYRHALVGAPLPGGTALALSFAVAWMVLVAGVVIFQRLQPRFAEHL